jgi:hypothetical protein
MISSDSLFMLCITFFEKQFNYGFISPLVFYRSHNIPIQNRHYYDFIINRCWINIFKNGKFGLNFFYQILRSCQNDRFF